MSTRDHTALNALIDSLKVEYIVEFIPFSRSRNAVADPKMNQLSINWRVTIKRGKHFLTTDYQQGIGNLPCKLKGLPTSLHNYNIVQLIVHLAVETGRFSNSEFGIGFKPLQKPELRDVLHALVNDSDVLDFAGSFEDWASNYGYDADSRKAERIYNECLKHALKMRAMFGDETLQQLHNAYQDY